MSKNERERRRSTRMDVPCPIQVRDPRGQFEASGRTINISDGGAMLSLPVNSLPGLAKEMKVVFSVPRLTPNTRMFEQFECPATVVRHQPLTDDMLAGMAIRFTRPLDLGLEV